LPKKEINKKPPGTVTEWKKLVLSNSQALLHGPSNLSSYFTTERERTPIQGYMRCPWNTPYYEFNLQSAGGGPRLLTAKAIIQNTGALTVNKVDPMDALWCMLLAKLCHRLTSTDQGIVVALFEYMLRRAKQMPGAAPPSKASPPFKPAKKPFFEAKQPGASA